MASSWSQIVEELVSAAKGMILVDYGEQAGAVGTGGALQGIYV